MTIRDILQLFNIQTAPENHHHCTSGFVQVDCPWCTPHSGKWRMGLARNGRIAKCWTCGSHSLIDSICELSKQSKQTIRDLVKSINGYNDKIKIRPRGKLVLPEGLGPLLPIHKKYLKSRGFNVEQLESLWGLQGIGINPILGWRIFIPVIYQEKIVSWTARALTDDIGKRYWNASSSEEEIAMKSILFGIDFIHHAILITEGPFDAMKIGPGAVATMGIEWTRAQLKQMIKYPMRVVCFDNEPDAQKRANELCVILNSFPGQTFNVALDAKDPGCASEEELDKLRKRFLE